MSESIAGLLDTSVFIAHETDRPFGEPPDHFAVSVVTTGELQLGVLHARDDAIRARHADTLALARAADPIPITEPVLVAWARLVSDCRSAGVHRTVKLTDVLIARTAVEHDLSLVNLDNDYDQIKRAHPALLIVKV